MTKLLKNLIFTGLFAGLMVSNLSGVNAHEVLTRELNTLRFVFSQTLTNEPAMALAEQTNQDTQSAIDKVTPGVVSIFGVDDATEPAKASEYDSSFIEDFSSLFRPIQKRSAMMVKISAGTGFFVDSDGYILTNKHVVANVSSDYSVTLANGKRKNADVVYRDPINDLAILKISGSNYPTLPLADSSVLKTGEKVVGIGNAFGKYPNTVSQGSVSGLHKTVIAGGDEPSKLRNLIQTTAQLYPGDSGGPLFNLNGEVIGINVAAAVDRNNMSFSIPINDAKILIESVIK